MTFLAQTVLQGAVGFAIGAGTNDLAIRWLFATVFTKKKQAIAESVKEVVSTELMSSEKIIARISSPTVRMVFERNIRAEIDDVFSKAGTLAGGLAGGLRPFLPDFVCAEADALRQVGAVFNDEVRSVIARTCANQLTAYLSNRLPNIVEETKIWDIIYDSIMALNEEKMEFLTRQVANRELRGITIWGGVIGALVGITMSVFIHLVG